MNKTLSLDAIRRHLPHVDADNLGGRPLPLHAVYEDGEWKVWIPDGKDGVLKIIARPFEALYFAKEPAAHDHLRLSVLEFLNQQANFPATTRFADGIYSDVQNLAVSLAKMDLIFAERDRWQGCARMVATELEYVFLNCRSLFDLFQELLVTLWGGVRLLDQSSKKRALPKSFRKMVLHDTTRMSVEEICEKHHIPSNIADAYHVAGSFFEWLRQYRDYIAHSGRDFGCIFVGDIGFAIDKTVSPFSGMEIWCDSNSLPNNLASLKSATCHVILTTLLSLEQIIKELRSVIQFPPPTVPGYGVFICGPHIGYLASLQEGISARPWVERPDGVAQG